MTFEELAKARGISKASAARLVRRTKWRRQANNEGRVRVLVPRGEEDVRKDSPPDNDQDIRADMSRTISVLRVRIADKDAVIAGKDAVIMSKDALIEAERAHVVTLKEQLHKAESELEQRRRGLVARVIAAWRGIDRTR